MSRRDGEPAARGPRVDPPNAPRGTGAREPSAPPESQVRPSGVRRRQGRLSFRGIAASPGIALGPAFRVDSGQAVVPRRRITTAEVDLEVARLQAALEASRRELEELRDEVGDGAGADHGLILDAHLMMHRDELLADATFARIRDRRINAEWALREILDALAARLGAASSGYFRERVADVEHVGAHILRYLQPTPGGGADGLPEGPVVLVARDLTPADAARLFRHEVQGVVTSLGSATGHTAILARALAIPAVVGVTDLTRVVAEGEELIVDALRGEVVAGGAPEEREQARGRARRYLAFRHGLEDKADPDAATRDGVAVELTANVDLPDEVPHVRRSGARGVGLYRTEFLFLDRVEPPTEEAQLAAYVRVVEELAPHPVVFRTCDLGADKLMPGDVTLRSQNPALGLRALRLSLARPADFRIQLRAILRAAAHGTVRLMFPMVATVAELRQAKAHLAAVRQELIDAGVSHGDPEIGVVVEVPSAAIRAEQLARECDFFSVGTNDLVQYTLALDRLNPWVADLARNLDPAVLRLIEMTVTAARRAHRRPPSICGDMASDPLALPLVVGLGVRCLSTPFTAVPLVRETVRRLRADEATRVAQAALGLDDAASVEALVRREFAPVLGDLWEEQGLAV